MSDRTPDTQTKRFQCRHIHADGRRCGSPALRHEELCYYHHTSRPPARNPHGRRSRQATFDLALPDALDPTGLQLAIADVLRRIASNQLDPRRAGLLLYGLQIASLNLPRQRPVHASEPVDEVVLDPRLGALAPRAELGHNNAGARRHSLIERLLADLEQGRAGLDNRQAPSGEVADPPSPSPLPSPLPDVRPSVEDAIPAPVTPAVLPFLKASATLTHQPPKPAAAAPPIPLAPLRQRRAIPRPHNNPPLPRLASAPRRNHPRQHPFRQPVSPCFHDGPPPHTR